MKKLSILLIFIFGALFSCISCIDTNATQDPHAGGGSVIENTQVACTDGVDNNNDGVWDCDDPDCFVFTICNDVQRDTIIAIVTEQANSETVYLSLLDDRVIVVAANYESISDSGNTQTYSSSSTILSSETRINDGIMSSESALNYSYSNQNLSSNEKSIDGILENTSVLCSDLIDNDGDGHFDCEDRGCFGMPFCQQASENTLALCSDQIDNDMDGLADCDDQSCAAFNYCADTSPALSCYPDGFTFPEFWEIPITIYDYPTQSPILGNDLGMSDSCQNVITKGMVEDTLGTNGLPVSKSGECSSSLINEWWAPNGTDSIYTTTLQLKSVDGGSLYSYSTHAKGFFPVPGNCSNGTGGNSGLECEPFSTRNYGFAVHMKYQFIYIEGAAREQNLFFSGDDDIFVFMNGHLVIDIGGRHEPQSESFNVWKTAQTLGLTSGEAVTIDFFIAERAILGSQAIIAVNMPCKLSTIQ